MATVFLVLVVVLVIAGLVFGVISLLSGDDPGMSSVDPDGRARPLPNNRSLSEFDLKDVRFDTGLRGYRMSQVDRVLRRTAYDLGYKDEMIAVLEAEVIALREGRTEDAELLRKARESPAPPPPPQAQAALVLPTEDHESASSVDAASEDQEQTEDVEDFVPSAAASAGTAESAAVEVEHGEAPAEDLPREGSLRRRREPQVDVSEDTGATASDRTEGSDPIDGSDRTEGANPVDGSDRAEGSDPIDESDRTERPDGESDADDDTATNPVDRPAPHA